MIVVWVSYVTTLAGTTGWLVVIWVSYVTILAGTTEPMVDFTVMDRVVGSHLG